MKEIIKKSLIGAIGTALYIALIATAIFYSHPDNAEDTPSVLIPIVMLMLFVFSAAVTGALILGNPLLWYIEGRKKEAIRLLVYTLGIFFIILLILLAILSYTT